MPPNGDVQLTCLESSCLQISSQNGLNYDSWLLCLHPSGFKIKEVIVTSFDIKKSFRQQGASPFSSLQQYMSRGNISIKEKARSWRYGRYIITPRVKENERNVWWKKGCFLYMFVGCNLQTKRNQLETHVYSHQKFQLLESNLMIETWPHSAFGPQQVEVSGCD